MNRDARVHEVTKALQVLYPFGGDGYVEIRCINFGLVGPKVLTHFYPLQDHRFYEQLASEMVGFMLANVDGRGYNAYIGRALRREPTVGSSANVDWVCSASIDVDAVRLLEGAPSSDMEYGRARSVADAVRAKWGGSLVHTGNGTQVWIPFSDARVDIRGRRVFYSEAVRGWESTVLSGHEADDTVRLDPQFDIPRIVKLPGSLSVKGKPTEERPHRWATIEVGTSYLTSEEILSHAPREDAGREVQGEESLPVPSRFWSLLRRDPKLLESFNATRGDLPSGRNTASEQDMALVSRLRGYRFTRGEAAAILRVAPRGARQKHDGYFGLTLDKVYGG